MRPIPEPLRSRPFSRDEADALGVTSRMLHGRRFVRVMPTVYRCRDHAMTGDDWVLAARLALPASARLTGITRIQQLGLDHGPRLPVRFVVEGDLHLSFDTVFLHRTKRLPPNDGRAVTPAAAFVAYCRRARVVDAIKVGDWLLHHEHMSERELRDLALAEQWRDGAEEALWIIDHLDGRARSLAESETRAVLDFACLPRPEVNRSLPLDDDVHLIGDLVFAQWRTVVEYDGGHHQEDRQQYLTDLDRYAVMRRHDVGYVQVTKEKLRHGRTLVGEVHRELVRRGYDGPPPRFDLRWWMLGERIYDLLAADRSRTRRGGASRTSAHPGSVPDSPLDDVGGA